MAAIYSHIEERYCTDCGKNVGIEYTHMEDGRVVKRCLNRSCGEANSNCFFNNSQAAE